MKTLAAWRELMNRRPLDEALRLILTESGYLVFAAGLTDGPQRVANLHEFLDRTQRFCESPQRQGLSRFREFLDALQEESDLGQPSIATDGGDAVRIMTIHRSKGLEFGVVVVPDLSKRHTMKSAEGSILVDRYGYAGLKVIDPQLRVRYPSLSWAITESRIRRQVIAEELRVLYVAATRACERLILVGTCTSKQAEAWKLRWSDHAGSLPIGTVMGSGSLLEWIGPAAFAISAQSSTSLNIHVHAPPEAVADVLPREKRSPLQRQLIAGEPLKTPPAPKPQAQAIIDRLSAAYRFSAMLKTPAVQSVTQVAEKEHVGTGRTIKLERLAFAEQKRPLSATEIGDATHLVMERVSFDPAQDLDAQIRKLVADKALLPQQAAGVNRDGIRWFIGSDLGRLMHDHPAAVRRERTIYFAAEGEGLDRTMIRGRVDTLIDLPDRTVIIDYKTDRRTTDQLDAQVEHHRAQLSLYAQALEKVLNKPIEAWLAFLTPKVNRRVV